MIKKYKKILLRATRDIAKKCKKKTVIALTFTVFCCIINMVKKSNEVIAMY